MIKTVRDSKVSEEVFTFLASEWVHWFNHISLRFSQFFPFLSRRGHWTNSSNHYKRTNWIFVLQFRKCKARGRVLILEKPCLTEKFFQTTNLWYDNAKWIAFAWWPLSEFRMTLPYGPGIPSTAAAVNRWLPTYSFIPCLPRGMPVTYDFSIQLWTSPQRFAGIILIIHNIHTRQRVNCNGPTFDFPYWPLFAKSKPRVRPNPGPVCIDDIYTTVTAY